MPQKTDTGNDDGGSIKVGTTGTIGSLMNRELESMKNSEQASSSVQRKHQTSPVSVPCGANPRKALQKRNHTNEQGSNGGGGSSSSSDGGSGTGHTHCTSQTDGQKLQHAPRKNGHRVPMLVPSETSIDNGKTEKKVHAYFVEVVDIKCNNPMSSRLKKLGFSKLSESVS